MRNSTAALVWSALVITLPGLAAATVLVNVDGLEPGALEVRGFALESDQEVQIKAVGLEADRHAGELAAAWILDAASRQVVWEMGDSQPQRRHRDLREYADAVRLPAGSYEACYATFPERWEDEGLGWWESAARALVRGLLGWDDYEEATEELALTVRGEGRRLRWRDLEAAHEKLRQDALVALAADGDHYQADQGFELTRPLTVEIYALGELTDDEVWDYGWIVDAETREEVWSFNYHASDRSGEARKNRVVRTTLELPAGKYAAFFVTDGSHSPEKWNDLPPLDPSFWGLTVWVADPSQRRFAQRFEYRHLPAEQVIAELTRLGDCDYRSTGITLAAPMAVRVYAVGEGHRREMSDYGWIADARTREKIWTMTWDRTRHAGGAQKNRVADEVVELGAGSYLVAFVTDCSHSYDDWNAARPSHPERWGITLFGVGESFDPAQVSAYREDEDPALLARIARVRNDRHERQEFTLDRDARVSVYALGEGSGERMFDYGWVEERATGRVVWEMTCRMTDGAGGASKNRLFEGVVYLPAGEYVLHYVTDDSHAFGNWNAPAPHDPEGWGIRLVVIAEPDP